MEFFVLNQRLGRVRVLIDDVDADLAEQRWHLAGGKGTVGRYVAQGGPLYLHRVIAQRMGLIAQVVGEGRAVPSVDHENGDKMDCRRANLRLRKRAQQVRNPNDRLRSTNHTGYRGVYYHPSPGRRKRWWAHVTVDGKIRSLGYYGTAEEAAMARQTWDEENA